MRSNITLVLLVGILFSCTNGKNIIPKGNLSKVKRDHCWPFNLKEYSINNLSLEEIDQYPKEKYFNFWDKDEIMQWTKLQDTDDAIYRELEYTFNICEENNTKMDDLSGQLYVSGSYTKSNGGKNKSFDKILLLDIGNNKMYIFNWMGR